MKALWKEMSQKVDQQKILTDKLIIDMTQQRYTNKLRAISIPETIGALICFTAAVFIMINFNELDTWYLQLAGTITIISCLILPILSLKSIQKMKGINIAKNTYKQSLIDYAKGKTQFLFIQKLSFYLSFFLIIAVLPVSGKLLSDINIFTENKAWIWLAPAGVPIFYFFAKWVFKNYKKTIASAEDILKELEN